MKNKNYQMKDKVHRSSSATYFYKYLLTLLFGGGLLLTLFFAQDINDQLLKGAIVTVSWAVIWLAVLIIRLRSVEASHESLVIKTFRGQRIIEYKDVDWIFQTVLITPVLISIKYQERASGKSRNILLIPTSENIDLNLLGETEMTKFIRERIKDSNPEYSNAMEPSRWRPIGLMLLTGLSALLVMSVF